MGPERPLELVDECEIVVVEESIEGEKHLPAEKWT